MHMSAIAGLIGQRFDETIRDQLLKTMVRRGPAAQGTEEFAGCVLLYALSGSTPEETVKVAQAGETWSIVFDGRLYNAQELRQELVDLGHDFAGTSDAETVLRSYIQWGEACLLKFNGVFALAIWAQRKQELFLARDRIGVKPLFYARRNGGILFASELKTILAHPDFPAQLDSQGAAEILLIGPGRTPGSGVFKGIEELENGCCGVFCNGMWRMRRYWKLQDREHTDSFAETVEKVRTLVFDAIGRQSVADTQPGAFLSGGLDSSLISAICAEKAKRQGRRLATFSLDYVDNKRYFHPTGFLPNSDTDYIHKMLDVLDTDHYWTVLCPKDLTDALEDATRARDLPGMGDVDFSLLQFCGQIRSHADVVLSGECADELFGGYPWFRNPEIRNQEGFPWAGNTELRASFLNPQIQIDAPDYVMSRYEDTIRECDVLPGTSAQERRMKEMFYLNFRWFMQTLLDRSDRMGMYHGLEIRVPFCDYRIAEYLYGVPWEFKDYQGREKGLLRKAMEGILPEEVLWRKKSPFPKTFDPAYLALVRQKLQNLLEDKDAPIFQLVRRQELEKLLTMEIAYPWYGQLMNTPQTIAYMLQIDFWMRSYGIELVS